MALKWDFYIALFYNCFEVRFFVSPVKFPLSLVAKANQRREKGKDESNLSKFGGKKRTMIQKSKHEGMLFINKSFKSNLL